MNANVNVTANTNEAYDTINKFHVSTAVNPSYESHVPTFRINSTTTTVNVIYDYII